MGSTEKLHNFARVFLDTNLEFMWILALTLKSEKIVAVVNVYSTWDLLLWLLSKNKVHLNLSIFLLLNIQLRYV